MKNKMMVVNGKIYGVCNRCGKLVRIDKPILGSLHFCLTDEEITGVNRHASVLNEKITYGCACGWYVEIRPFELIPKHCGHCAGSLQRGAKASCRPAGEIAATARSK